MKILLLILSGAEGNEGTFLLGLSSDSGQVLSCHKHGTDGSLHTSHWFSQLSPASHAQQHN